MELGVEEKRIAGQLYGAEYTAMMARIEQMTNRQLALWAALVAYVAAAAKVDPRTFRHPYALVWGSVAVVQVIAIFWIDWQTDIYRTLEYIRKELAPAAQQLLGEGVEVFRNKPYLDRMGRVAIWFESLPLAVVLLALALAIPKLKHDWQYQWIGVVSNGAALVFVIVKLLVMQRVRGGKAKTATAPAKPPAASRADGAR